MYDENTETESEFTQFFAGLDAGLKTLREVRSVYDEQVAFEFNATSFFSPDENKTSEILAFFLDPNKNHGQKGTLLKLFVKHFDLQMLPSKLLEDLNLIKVIPEDTTAEKRRIDITIQFGNDEYIIGIENKIGTAPDLHNQLHDYVKELRDRMKGDDKRWTLFYLTPYGDNPSDDSISAAERLQLVNSKNGNLRVISYCEDIIGLLGQYEMSCKAENVRAFLKDFGQYLKQKHLGKTFMGENNFASYYLRKHPEILRHTDALRDAVDSLKLEFFNAFWGKLEEHLKTQDIDVDLANKGWITWGSWQSEIKHSGRILGGQGELVKVAVFYGPNLCPSPSYIAIIHSKERKYLSSEMKSRVERMEECLRNSFKEVSCQDWLCAVVAIPHPEFSNGEAICEFLRDGSKMQHLATEAAKTISKYLKIAESSLRETHCPQ